MSDAARLPPGVAAARGKAAQLRALRQWWVHRAIPRTRDGLAARLRELGLEGVERLPFASLGLSLSDQYWVLPEGASLAWEDVNFFLNDYELGDGGWLSAVGLASPDNTSEGELPKRWAIEDGRRVLLKGAGPLGQEPYNEAAACALFERLLDAGEYVPYEVRLTGEGLACACPCFVGPTEEYVPAYYVRQRLRQPNHLSDYRHIIECCVSMGAAGAERALSKMIVCDYILGNFDRHLRNFGVVRDVESLRCRMAPLFDTGSCLACNKSLEDLRAGHWGFSTKPFYEDANRQLRLVDDYSWLDFSRLEGFEDQVGGILRRNPAMEERAGYVCEALAARIQRLRRIAE